MGLGGGSGTSTQQRSDASQQFRKCEGFDQVIVSPQLKSFYPILNSVSRREEKHRDIFSGCSHFLKYFPAIQPRHHHIENQQVIRLAQCVLKRVFAIGKAINIEPRLSESLLQINTYFGFVFRNQKSHGDGSRIIVRLSLQ